MDFVLCFYQSDAQIQLSSKYSVYMAKSVFAMLTKKKDCEKV